MKDTQFTPPVADRIEHVHPGISGSGRVDFYQWMRLSDHQKNSASPDADTEKVVSHLEAENGYTHNYLQHTEDLQRQLYDEIVGRIAPDDETVPYKSNGYVYQTNYVKGQEYPIYRRKQAGDQEYTTLLDVNEKAADKAYCQIGGLKVSPNNKLLAYAEDTVGRRQYGIYVIEIENNKTVAHLDEDTTGQIVWGGDSNTIYYVKKDAALRPCSIVRHILGSESHEVIYHEEDERFRVYISKTKSKEYILIGSASSLTTEYRYIKADDNHDNVHLFAERVYEEEYHPSHHGNHWYIRSNANADNFALHRCPISGKTDRAAWMPYIDYDPTMYIQGVDMTRDHLILSVRYNGQTELYYKGWEEAQGKMLRLDEAAYAIYPGTNADYDTQEYRVKYTSMTTPITVMDVDLKTGQKTVLKEQKVVGDFNKDDYNTERLMAEGHDGTLIPISLVYKKEFADLENRPLLLYAYGSYGYSIDPYFSSARLSLLDRGISFAIAHIRGGAEYGYQWYKQGKFLQKKNTFHDFISCAEHLVKNNKVDKSRLFAMGGSAGGLLMGAVMNMRPDLWRGIVAAVPFVDVVSTMLDDTIPLTVGEYEEWGNPNDQEYYDYMLSYSPYDQVSSQAYPATLVTSGYHDSQVQYWEPTKWVAKLRHYNTGHQPILLHTNMDAGHSGATGRYKIHKETALEYAFVIDQADLLAD